MSKFLKVIGILLWVVSGFSTTFVLMIGELNGVKVGVFDLVKWTFALSFVFTSPYYLWTIFSNTLFLSEKKIRELKLELQNKISKYNDAAVEYSRTTKKCFLDVQELKDYLNIKSKEERVKDIDSLFDNIPITDEIRELRYKVLKYIQENG
jgi:hypothetical protein